MGGEGDGVGHGKGLVGPGQGRVDLPIHQGPGFHHREVSEQGEEIVLRWQWRWRRPFDVELLRGADRLLLALRDDADEVPIADDGDNTWQAGDGGLVDR